MARKAVLFLVVVVPFLIALSPLSQSADKPPSAKKEALQKEIQELIAKLGHADSQVREKATKRLEQIGKPALEHLNKAQKGEDREVRRRAELLIRNIEWRFVPSALVNGMKFRVVVDKRWTVPSAQGKNVIGLVLEVRNTTDRRRGIFPGGIDLTLTDSQGKQVPVRGGTGRSTPMWFSPTLEKDENFSVPLKAYLTQHPGNLEFGVVDSFTTFWSFNNLSRGSYYLSVRYRNSLKKSDTGVPLWTGSVETPSQSVVIE